MPEGALVLLVGPPASGKSTYAAALVAAGVVAPGDVLSSDDVRAELTGSAEDIARDRAVFVRLRRDLSERLAAGRTTVVDATNLWPRKRARHVRVAREHGRPVVAVLFEVPVGELLARNAARERSVPVPAVLGMARQMRENVTEDALRAEGADVVLRATSAAP